MKRIILFIIALFFSAAALAAVNINTATKEELDALPGIGPVKAQAILDYRKANGPFKTPEDIMKVSGIKEGTYAKIKGLISVSGASKEGLPLTVSGPLPPPFSTDSAPIVTSPLPPPATSISLARVIAIASAKVLKSWTTFR